MSRLGKITRRSFLVVSAAVAGGVAFGYYKYQQDPDNPLTAGAGETVFNPWVIVREDGVTVITPRAEMGQGIHTTLAALVAEEMDLAWDEVRAEHGPPAAAYANTAIIAQGTPFPEYEDSRMKSLMQGGMEVMGKFLGLQITGGSTSTIDAFDRMRTAGAAARAVLVEAAAARLGRPAAELRTREGAVVAPDGMEIPYGDLAAEAAGLAPPADPPLKDPADWKLLGRDLPRLDMAPKVTGTATFAGDIRLPGMRFASVRMSPRLGGGMTGFDAGEAEGMPGVERVLDLGDGIAVVATTTWTAMRALSAIDIQWGEAPYPATTEAIFERIAAAFDADASSTMRDEGDAQAAREGAEMIEAEYRVPYLAHTTMEPMNATALFEDGRLTIWAGNQAPGMIRDKAAEAAGLDPENVEVVTTVLGGGFGRRAEFDVTNQAARVAVEMPGTPVQLMWSREEDVRHDYYRPGAMARMTGAVGTDGPTLFDAKIAAPSVMRQSGMRFSGMAAPGPDKLLLEGAFDQPYAIPNYRVAGHAAEVDVPIGYWRSVGYSHNAFFHECFVDELAHAAGQDPVEMRLQLIRPEHAVSARVVEAAAEMANWGGTLPEGHAQGIAFCYSFGAPTAEVVEVRQGERGLEIVKVCAAQDVGTALDPRNIEAQLVGGIVYGLSAAIMEEITFADGEVTQSNFHDFDALRIDRMPEVETRILTANDHMGGVGEPGTPPAAPALANAVFALTGERIRELPLNRHVDFA